MKLYLLAAALALNTAHSTIINWEIDTVDQFKAVISDSHDPNRPSFRLDDPLGLWDISGYVYVLDQIRFPFLNPETVIMGFRWQLDGLYGGFPGTIQGDATHGFDDFRDRNQAELFSGEHWDYPYLIVGLCTFEIVSRPDVYDLSTWGWEAVVQGQRNPFYQGYQDVPEGGSTLALLAGGVLLLVDFARRKV